MNIKKILIGAATGVLMLGTMVTPAFAAIPNWDLTGNWTFNDIWLGTPYVHTMNITSFDPVTGVFSGKGYHNDNPSLTWNVNGVENGNYITLFHLLVTAVTPGVTIEGTGIIDATGTGISGTGYQSNLPGSDPNIQWTAVGIARAIVDICPAGTNRTLLETKTVLSDSSVVTPSENVLLSGQKYLLVPSGTWQNRTNPNQKADAEYATMDNWATWMDGYDFPDYHLGLSEFDLQVDGNFVNWGVITLSINILIYIQELDRKLTS